MNEYTELIAELRDGADFQDAIDPGRIREAADAIEALVKERDEWVDRADDAYAYNSDVTDILEQFRETERERDELKLAVNIQDRMAENYAAVELQRLELAAVVEKVRDVASEPRFVNGVDREIMDILSTAAADALREHDAALIESLADDRGVDASEDHDDEWWVGYRQAQREIIHWLTERARQVREGEA